MKQKKYIQKVNLPEVDYKKVLVYGIIFFMSYVFISNALIKYFNVKQKCKILEQKLSLLKTKNSELKQELSLVKTDSATIEYYVRKELGYMKQGEKLYILKKSSEKQNHSNEKSN
ncbi:MAG: septum formation initiator family protein [Endomicrobiia bacterium]